MTECEFQRINIFLPEVSMIVAPIRMMLPSTIPTATATYDSYTDNIISIFIKIAINRQNIICYHEEIS